MWVKTFRNTEAKTYQMTFGLKRAGKSYACGLKRTEINYMWVETFRDIDGLKRTKIHLD